MATCVGPPDVIAMGSPTVLIGNLMAARMGDPTVHGGVIVLGCPTVMIGIPGMGSVVTVSPMAPGLGAAANVSVAAYIAGGHSWWLAGIAGAIVGSVWNYAVSSVFTWRR